MNWIFQRFNCSRSTVAIFTKFFRNKTINRHFARHITLNPLNLFITTNPKSHSNTIYILWLYSDHTKVLRISRNYTYNSKIRFLFFKWKIIWRPVWLDYFWVDLYTEHTNRIHSLVWLWIKLDAEEKIILVEEELMFIPIP